MVKYTLILLLLAGVLCNENKPSLFSRLKSLKCAFPPREILDQLPSVCKKEDLSLSKLSDKEKPFRMNKDLYLCIGLLEVAERLCELAKESSSFSTALSTYVNKTMKESPPNIVNYCTTGKHSAFIESLKYEGSRILFEKITDTDKCEFVCAEQSSNWLVSPICRALFDGNDMLQAHAETNPFSTGTAGEEKSGSISLQQTADQQSQPLEQPPEKETGSELAQLNQPSQQPSQPGRNLDQLHPKLRGQEPQESDALKPPKPDAPKSQKVKVPKLEESVVPQLQNPDAPKSQKLGVPNPEESVVPQPQNPDAPKSQKFKVPKPEESVVPKPEESVVPKPEESVVQKPEGLVVPKPPQNTELEDNHNMDDGENQNNGESSNTGNTEDKAPDSNVGSLDKSRLTPAEVQSDIRNPVSNLGGSNSGGPAVTPSSGNVPSVLKGAKSDDTDSTNVGTKEENLPVDENVNPDKMDQNNPAYQVGLDAGNEDDGTNAEDEPSLDDEGELHNGQAIEEGKSSNVDASQIGSVQKDVPNVPLPDPEKSNAHHETYSQFVEAEDSHFFTYFLIGSLLCIIGYLLYHNKRKIIAMAVEGKKGRNSGRRRPHSASYHKLDSNLEEAMSSNFTSSNSYVIY